MKIVVLCGGVSSEREISLRSSTKVATALKSRGHQVLMVDVFFGTDREMSFEEDQDFARTADELRTKNHLITPERIRETGLFGPGVLDLCRKADVVFIGLHGENGEDGKVQSAFEAEKIPYTGSDPAGSAIAMSKEETKKIVAPHILMPDGIILRRGEPLPDPIRIKVPFILKPSNGGSSVGVMIIRDEKDFEGALEQCFQYDDTILMEEFIEGRELTQGVLDGKALPPVEICPDEGAWYDYTNKYSGKTREVCPAPIDPEALARMSEISVRFGELVGLSVYYRIDYLLTKDGRLYALEANSLPGMTDTSLVPQEAAAVGISYPELCEKIIDISLRK
ncbi:MAG: D-alanine--D-alanine ligase [Parasporobacterium sp.]|nr:D-alanine--D-alanine ligase [Parasporobacterium sp.]